MTEEIYKPPGASSLDNENYLVQVRVGLHGSPKSGKTYSAAGFPNPIFLSYDRGLASHIGRKDILEIPFYDDAFIDKMCPRTAPKYVDLRDSATKVRPTNRKDALPLWLSTEAVKLTSNQTLVIDGSTGIQSAYHQQYWVNPKVTKDGPVDKWGEWNWKVDYFTEIMTLLKGLRCNVVYICHEQADRDEKGELNGKIRPLLRGQFVDELPTHFTDWFRSLAIAKPSLEKMPDFKKKFSLSDAEAKEWIESTPPNNQTIYIWQVRSDNLAECGTSMVGCPNYVLAKYESFNKYKRKVNG